MAKLVTQVRKLGKIKMKQQDIIIKQQKKIEELEKREQKDNGSWSTREGILRYSDTSKPLHNIEILDNIVHNPKHLKRLTGCTFDKFQYLLNEITRRWKEDPNAPLCTEDGLDIHGNRCKLPRRHILLLTLERLRQGTKQPSLALHYGVDQSAVSRYLNYTISIIKKFLPTATNISKYLRTCTLEELEKLVPNMEMMLDGTHVPIERPNDNETRKAYYSGKKKRFSMNTNIIINNKGLIIAKGRSVPGSTHDLTLFRDDNFDLGFITEFAMDPNTPEELKIIIRVDLGYNGIAKDLPGAIIKINHKRSKHHELTKRELEDNRRLNRKRVKVEHIIGKIKQYKLMTGPYENSDEQFEKELDVITGLVNLDHLWDYRKKRPKISF